MPGVVRFITAKDIKGKNNYNAFYLTPTYVEDPVRVSLDLLKDSIYCFKF